jgi:uncharacterized protein YcfJ
LVNAGREGRLARTGEFKMTAWRKMLMAVAGLATAATVIPTAALADGHGRGHRKHHRHHHHHHERIIVEERPVYYRERVYVEERPVYYREAPRYYREAPRRAYRSSCRSGGTTGLIVGGAAGALLGREIDGGRDRTAGTIIGAGAGALLGREIDRNDRC